MGTTGSRVPEDPWIDMEAVIVQSGNPVAITARYHKEGERTLADDYDVRRIRLGKGRNGNIMLAVGRLDGQKYAVKSAVKRDLSTEQKEAIARGAGIHLALDHPNVAKLADIYETAEELAVVMECCGGGTLFNRVIKPESLKEADAAAVTRQILRPVGYLHARSIIHCAVKLEHFVYESKDDDAPLKLIGFNSARVWGPGMPMVHTSSNSVSCMSPDMLHPEGYTNKCDMWGVGVILFKLLTGYMPFSWDGAGMTFAILESKQKRQGRDRFHVSAEALSLAKALLADDPEQRPDADLALGHRWLMRLSDAEEPRLSKKVVSSMHEYACASRLPRAVRQVLARELLPEEVEELRRLFFGLDQTVTGTISYREFADAFCDSGREPSADLAQRCLSTASTADTEPRSAVSVGTLSPVGSDRGRWQLSGSTGKVVPAGTRLQWGHGGAGPDLTQAHKLFKALDVKGDGEVCWSDFMAAGLGSLPQLRDSAVRRTFSRFDADGAGTVGAEDLLRALGGPFEGADPGALTAVAGVLLDAQGKVGPCSFAALMPASGTSTAKLQTR